jgi:death-on-curing protein
MLFLAKQEVLEIHRQVIEQTGGLPGIRDVGLLDSALLAPPNRRHYEGVGVAVCAATYAFHLTRNHPFVDGNKRIGAAVAEVFVRLNGFLLTASNDELVDLFLSIAAGAATRETVEHAFVQWVVCES